MLLVVLALLVWIGAWWLNARLANGAQAGTRAVQLLVPAIFGGTLLIVWELLVRGLGVPLVILPAPSVIAERFAGSIPILWADFSQTILKGALGGYIIGCGAAFVMAILVDRSDFLRRGLLPVGNFVAALPIVGTAPILVMWFGFDWQSKAAVVVVMVFFPMLVNTVAGLRETDQMQRDLMATYAASYWQSLFKLRLPAALPFIFNGSENFDHAGADWCHCRRVLWLSHGGDGLSDFDLGWAACAGYGLGRDRGCGPCRVGLLRADGGAGEGFDLLAPLTKVAP